MKKINIEELISDWKELNEIINECDSRITLEYNKIECLNRKLRRNYVKHSEYLSQYYSTKNQAKKDRYEMFGKALDYLVASKSESNEKIKNMEEAKKQYYNSLYDNKKIINLYDENYEQNSEIDTLIYKKQIKISKFKMIKLFLSIKQKSLYKKIVKYLGEEAFKTIINQNEEQPKQKVKK